MIDVHEMLVKYVQPFKGVKYIYLNRVGFIAWRLGTGGNVELLHIRAASLRNGLGRRLFKEMLDSLYYDPPYFSVFGFTRVSNDRAVAFYEAMGFKIQLIDGLYKDGEAYMFWAEYTELMKKKEEYENSVRG